MVEGSWWKNKMIWVIVLALSAIVIALIGFFGYRGYQSYGSMKLLIGQQKDQIAINEATIAKSEKNRQYLAGQIAKKIAEAKNIKEPKNVEEIKQRLLQLGFHPIAGKR